MTYYLISFKIQDRIHTYEHTVLVKGAKDFDQACEAIIKEFPTAFGFENLTIEIE